MKSLVKNKQGSAILISLIILVLITIMSTVFLEKIYRFSQASEGIENSNVAYYSALGLIEKAMYTGGVNKYTPWNVKNTVEGGTFNTGRVLLVSTGGNTVPISGKGNSPYDPEYNLISVGEPVQLVIPEGIDWNDVNFDFRVPSIKVLMDDGVTYTGASNTGIQLTPTLANSGFILWTLSSSGVTLFASGEENTIRGADIGILNLRLSGKLGTTNSGSFIQFKPFYESNQYLGTAPSGSICTGYKCTLKLSLLRPVPLEDKRIMNFLEYKITFPSTTIPSQYMTLHAEGYAYGFLRSKDLLFPQITTNTALDFAVLQ